MRPGSTPPWNDRWVWISYELGAVTHNLACCPLGLHLLRLARPPISLESRRCAVEVEMWLQAQMTDEDHHLQMEEDPFGFDVGLDDLDWTNRGGSLPCDILESRLFLD